MGDLKVSFHDHPLLPFSRFTTGACRACPEAYIVLHGGYFCNEIGCHKIMFHKECAESLPEINHSSHPDHPLHLVQNLGAFKCNFCREWFGDVGYSCSKCDFKLHLSCARRPPLPQTLENSKLHEHSLVLSDIEKDLESWPSDICEVCEFKVFGHYYGCHQCQLVFHPECVSSEVYHTSHPQHALKFINEAPDYADEKCVLCPCSFTYKDHAKHHHCDICNFSICVACVNKPPPLGVLSLTTHEHQLHVIPRRLDFTCNACGTQGDRSPYFCHQCNFMIHRKCIDLPRVININRHDHRVSYTRRLGYGNWRCNVCRKEVDGFYGAYTCSRCLGYAVHARCATRDGVWDKRELEGIPEEEEIEPFEVVDDMTIKHFSHEHNLVSNSDGMILQENTLCEACVFQIGSESFYSCQQCYFVVHEKCANLPRKKRHVSLQHPLTLCPSSHRKAFACALCHQKFTGMRYQTLYGKMIDVRCGSLSEPFVHECHPHPLYYSDGAEDCSACPGSQKTYEVFACDECDFVLDFWCAFLPQEVTRLRYDDHPLFLSYGESNVDDEYWCEACETTLDPNEWFYTCVDCMVTLHVSCVVGDFSYMMPGSSVTKFNREVVPNTSICRFICSECNSRCKLPSILKVTKAGVEAYFCSLKCSFLF